VTTRQRLPPGARWLTLPGGERRVELTIDAGTDPSTGRRRQSRRRYRTAVEAIDAYAGLRLDVQRGTYVGRTSVTIGQLIDDWLSARRLSVRASTLAGYEQALLPVRRAFGELPGRSLSRQNVVDLIEELRVGGTALPGGRTSRPWKARTVNLMLFALTGVLEDAVGDGRLARNVVAGIGHLPQPRKEFETLTAAEVACVLQAAASDELEHAWHLSMYGLRRGEVAGLRWEDIDFALHRVHIRRSRVSVDGTAVASLPKTAKGTRSLPLTVELGDALRRAMERQRVGAGVVGEAYRDSGFVVVNAIGDALHPDTLSSRWVRLLAGAGVRRVRLHDARHTCGTLLHLQGVPVAVIAAWLGHADAAFTMRTYVHSQDDALMAAAEAMRHGL
jgi:integrase